MIHTYSLYGINFCMDVESGAVHILESAAFDLLNALSPKGEDIELGKECPKEAISALSQYKKEMQGIYTTCVSRETLDESPMAYKPMEAIVSKIGDTVEILERLTPVYNFKAGDDA